MTYLNRLFSTILLSIFYSLSQETEAQSISLPLDLRINKEVAQRDIALHKIKIFGQGGISPVAYRKEDSLFERRYHITYMLFGCVAPYEYDSMEEYNLEIGKYLDTLYGTNWRRYFHQDVIALRQ